MTTFEQKQHEELTEKFATKEQLQQGVGSHIRALKGQVITSHDVKRSKLLEDKKDMRELMFMLADLTPNKVNVDKLPDVPEVVDSLRLELRTLENVRSEFEEAAKILEQNDEEYEKIRLTNKLEIESRLDVIYSYIDDIKDKIDDIFVSIRGNLDWSKEIKEDMKKIEEKKSATTTAQEEGYSGA